MKAMRFVISGAFIGAFLGVVLAFVLRHILGVPDYFLIKTAGIIVIVGVFGAFVGTLVDAAVKQRRG